MKKSTSRLFAANLAIAGGLVTVFAGCQIAPVTKAPAAIEQEGNVKGNIGKGTSGTPNQGLPGTGVVRDNVAPNAKVTGVVTDTAGKPVADVSVVTYHGFTAKTDAAGKFTIDVAGQDELRLDFSKPGYLNRQELIGVAAGMEGKLQVAIKPLDAKISALTAAAGGTATNADGSAILEVPPGALTADSEVRLTWMDPMPSDTFPVWSGELPGNLVTRTRPDGDKAAENLALPPLAFTEVEFLKGSLAPGAQATLRMKVNPEALRLSANQVDFANPATLQQPCYDFDRTSGLWVNPATSRLEKDAKGDVWFVYTVRGNEAPKNYQTLSHVTGQQTITWQETQAVQRVVRGVGGSTRVVTEYVTVTRSRIEDLKGKHFGGRVIEKSSNPALDGKGLADATVFHARDFFGGTTKTSGGNGGFDIPMWHNSNGASVSGGTYFKATGTASGMDVTINTDFNLTLKLEGAWNSEPADKVEITYKIDGVAFTKEVKAVTEKNLLKFTVPRGDNDVNFELVSVETPLLISATVAPAKNLVPGDKREVPVPMQFKSSGIK